MNNRGCFGRFADRDPLSRHRLVAIVLLCIATSPPVTGCGPAATVVNGTITLDGQPLNEAAVQFFPVDGDGQTHHAFTDAKGVYRTKISPVPMMVVVSKSKVVGQREEFPDTPPVDVMEESLPAQYSDRLKTELRVTPVESQTVVADFALTSDAK